MLQEYLGFLKQVYLILIFVNEFQADVFKAIGILTIFQLEKLYHVLKLSGFK